MSELSVRARRPPAIALAAYTAVVLLITLYPSPPGPGQMQRSVDIVLDWLHERGILPWLDFLGVEFSANIAMLVPLGVLTALLMPRRRRWSLLLVGTAFSAAIELTQLLLLPERFPELRDVASNSIGFLLGAGVALTVMRFRR